MSAAAPFEFAGQRFQMLADRALFWPRHGALIVADLHLEKASWYAALGQPLPPYDSHDTLDRLAALGARTGARAIWCLGDSFHDRDAAARIVPAVADRLARQAQSAALLWVAGNHDGLSAGAWGGAVAEEMVVDGIVFRHRAERDETRPEISGHFHPKLRTQVRGRHVARACFVGDERRLILPAFGSLAGGLAADDAAIADNFAGAYRAMLVAGGRRLDFPCRGRAAGDATARPATADS